MSCDVITAADLLVLVSQKLIPELQKLFMSKNETNVLKLWPLFVKLLGKVNKVLHPELNRRFLPF